MIIVSGGTFTMTGGNIVGCTAGSGGGVDVSGTFSMTGGSIAGCVLLMPAAAVCMWKLEALSR